jgi:hypothetical protein
MGHGGIWLKLKEKKKKLQGENKRVKPRNKCEIRGQ